MPGPVVREGKRSAPSPCVIGFAPEEISALINYPVVAEHAGNAVFLWRLREQAAGAAHYKLKHLAKLDSRLRAHLHGLQIAAEAGSQAAQRALGEADAGAVFVAAFLAYSSRDLDRMRQMMEVALAEPGFEKAVRAALAWQDNGVVPILQRLASSSHAAHRRVALAVTGARRAAPGAHLVQAARDDDPDLRARALRCIGETAQRDHLPIAQDALQDPQPQCRFWAGWSLALLGSSRGARTLFEMRAQLPSREAAALQVSIRCGEIGWARDRVRGLAAEPGERRSALIAAGALGDPAAVPWILDHLEDPLHARVAGEAFSTLTGADFDYLDLDRDPPADAPDPVTDDEDLRWPEPAAVRAWWDQHRGRFAAGERFLCGESIASSHLGRVLREGFQRQRQAAAIELVRMKASPAVFPVRARADWQTRTLGA